MTRYLSTAMIALGILALMPSESKAVTCVNGVYRAGCAGPNGAAVATKPPATVRRPGSVTCANGVYRAGCAGPNGAAVVRKPY